MEECYIFRRLKCRRLGCTPTEEPLCPAVKKIFQKAKTWLRCPKEKVHAKTDREEKQTSTVQGKYEAPFSVGWKTYVKENSIRKHPQKSRLMPDKYRSNFRRSSKFHYPLNRKLRQVYSLFHDTRLEKSLLHCLLSISLLCLFYLPPIWAIAIGMQPLRTL